MYHAFGNRRIRPHSETTSGIHSWLTGNILNNAFLCDYKRHALTSSQRHLLRLLKNVVMVCKCTRYFREGGTDRHRAPNLFQVIFTAPNSVLVDFCWRFVIITCRDVSVIRKNLLMQVLGYLYTAEIRIYFGSAIIFLCFLRDLFVTEAVHELHS